MRALLLFALCCAASADVAERLKSGSLPERGSAVDEILAQGGFPDEAVPALLDGLGDRELWFQCKRALLLRPAVAVPEIVRRLERDQLPDRRSWRRITAQRREAMINVLAAAREQGRAAVPVLRAIADADEIVLVRADAASALWRITMDREEAMPKLLRILDDGVADGNEEVIGSVSRALQEIGPDAAPAAGSLVRALGICTGSELYVGKGLGLAAAEDALRRIGPRAIPSLVQALGDANTRLRFGARSALSSLGGDAVEPLAGCLGDPRRARDAAWALGRIGPVAAQALPALRRARDNASQDLAKEIDEAVCRIEKLHRPDAVPCTR